ncbi:MAG: hypothetical protein ABI553_05915 [Chloroflexota bacterium]
MLPTVTILRHAEKELGGVPPLGVAIDGSRDPESLIVRGWQRAGALVALFSPPTDRASGGVPATPSHLFASRVGETTSLSRRPRETLEPLSEHLGLAIDDRFLKSEIGELVSAIRGCDGAVLVAWEHKVIPLIAAALTGDPATTPTTWPDDRFDVCWVFEPVDAGTIYGFRQVSQMLLAGDRAEPI